MPTIIFAGDSITDAGRHLDPEALGDGYVRILASSPELHSCLVLNKGNSGERVKDLLARWETDVIDEEPAIVTVLIGVNDTWRRFDMGETTTAARFEEDYRALLDYPSIRFVLVEPFLLVSNEEQHRWREDLDEKIDVVRRLALEYGTVLVPADSALRAAGTAEALAPDGIHPSATGHRFLADLWLDHTADLRGSSL